MNDSKVAAGGRESMMLWLGEDESPDMIGTNAAVDGIVSFLSQWEPNKNGKS